MTHYVTFCSHVCKQFEHSVLHLHSNSTIRKHASFHWCAHSFNQDKYGWKDTLQKIIYVWTWKRNRSVKKTTQLNSVLLSSWDFHLPPCNFFNIGQNFRSLQFKMWFTKKLKIEGPTLLWLQAKVCTEKNWSVNAMFGQSKILKRLETAPMNLNAGNTY